MKLILADDNKIFREALVMFLEVELHHTIIAITDYFEKAYLRELISTGFKACLFKDLIYKDLESIISKVNMGWLKKAKASL